MQTGVHHPCAARAILLYSAGATKILRTGLIIEAFLYEEQTRRGISLRPLRGTERRGRPLHRLSQVPQPVPVNIDFRAMSRWRHWRRSELIGQKRLSPATAVHDLA